MERILGEVQGEAELTDALGSEVHDQILTVGYRITSLTSDDGHTRDCFALLGRHAGRSLLEATSRRRPTMQDRELASRMMAEAAKHRGMCSRDDVGLIQRFLDATR